MAWQKTPEDHVPVRQVNNILHTLRGEHFRHARNAQGKPVSTSSLSSHAHNQPTLPINLIYPSQAPAPCSSRAAGPSPPRSWRPAPLPKDAVKFKTGNTNTSEWRARALLLLFSPNITPSSSSSESARCPLTCPDPNAVPQLSLLCLQLIRAACPAADLAELAPHIPLHLRRALLRYTAVHAPLSQTELDALCDGAIHVDSELIVAAPHNTLRGTALRKNDHATGRNHDVNALEGSDSSADGSWDAAQPQDGEPPALLSLAVLSSPLSAATFLALPPTITHLALINVPHRVPLQRLPTICPLLVLLDLSYNAWLCPSDAYDRGGRILEEVGWGKLRRLEVLGLRGFPVASNVLVEVNRGRWQDVRIIQ